MSLINIVRWNIKKLIWKFSFLKIPCSQLPPRKIILTVKWNHEIFKATFSLKHSTKNLSFYLKIEHPFNVRECINVIIDALALCNVTRINFSILFGLGKKKDQQKTERQKVLPINLLAHPPSFQMTIVFLILKMLR